MKGLTARVVREDTTRVGAPGDESLVEARVICPDTDERVSLLHCMACSQVLTWNLASNGDVVILCRSLVTDGIRN